MELDPLQQKVFDRYKDGENIFITGPGGTGKSELIKKIYLDAKENGKNIQVTALTGCAAMILQCHAKTIHSWAGIGIANGTIDNVIERVINSKYKLKNWRKIDILIVDEVSMMSKKIFLILVGIANKIRKRQTYFISRRGADNIAAPAPAPVLDPFGGIQVIFSGDFYQLPPVGKLDEPETTQFCFETEEWNKVFPRENQIQLTTIFRQKDPIYANILNQIRKGVLKKKSNAILMQHIGKKPQNDLNLVPTKIYPKKYQVDEVNIYEMSCLDQETERIFKIKESRENIQRDKYSEEDVELELMYLKTNILCDSEIKLRKGSQVMCIVNKEYLNKELEGYFLYNGCQGIVTDFSEQNLPIVKFNHLPHEIIVQYHLFLSENIPGIGVLQIPLILSWAITIHKAQGTTLEIAEIDAGSGIFECGQCYVALSRVKSLEGLYLKYFDSSRIKVNSRVKTFYALLDAETVPQPI